MPSEHPSPRGDGAVFDDYWYDTPAAAAILGVTPGALEQDRCTGRFGGIPFARLGRLVRYSGRTLKTVMREREQSPTRAQR